MNHPNLIKIFEVIDHTSKVVFVMEYAEAGPVAQVWLLSCMLHARCFGLASGCAPHLPAHHACLLALCAS
jgi:hypothetical protein